MTFSFSTSIGRIGSAFYGFGILPLDSAATVL